MNIPRIGVKRRRIGVIGLYRSGKTVFLTSLINHLRHHRPKRFVLGRNARFVFAEALAPSVFEAFPYAAHRNRLVKGQAWPEKTRGVSEYRFSFYRTDWRLSRGELSLLDFPGERMADLMMVNASFEQWSELVLTIFREQSEYRELAGPYLSLLDRGDSNEDMLISEYRRLLVRCFHQFRPVVTPSSVLISPEGEWFGQKLSPNGDAPQACFVGLDVDQQFAPLSQACCRRDPAMRKRFARHYRAYRRRVAYPLAAWMRGCDALAVLVDVTALLEGGEAMYQGNREVLCNLINLLKPGAGYFGLTLETLAGILSPLGRGPWRASGITSAWDRLQPLVNLRWNAIRRIAFVATKADKVLEQDANRLRERVRDMAEDIVARREMEALRLRVDYFACAAVRSTRNSADGKLQACLGPGRETQGFTPSQVPAGWPATWLPGAFRFPNVQPWMPSLRDAAPDHIELDRVADFLLR